MIILSGVILGWISGVLVNYLADVLPNHRRLEFPTCQHCGSRFRIINYIFFPRICKECKERRANRTWLVEFSLILIFFILTQFSTSVLPILIQFLVIIYFAVVTVIDIEHRLILNLSSMVGAVIGFAVGVGLHGLQHTIIGGVFGYITMLGLYLLGSFFVSHITHNRDPSKDVEALGFGDVTLGGVIGLFMGYPGIFLSLILAIFSAGLVSLAIVVYKLAIHQYKSDLAIPYGPFLVFGSFIMLFFNEHILNWINW